jgi:endonuclease-3
MNKSEKAIAIHQALINHYGFPKWRDPKPPLDELVSTILSQNTNDNNRDRAFEALQSRYSSWEAVRDANPQELIDTIRPAGLANQKGPRIQEALKQITDAHGTISLDFLSEFPPEEAKQWLMQFKGVGPKTAAIVLLFSLGFPAFPVDTHIYRVTGRSGLRPSKMNAEQAHDYLAKIFPEDTYYPVHLNIIRLGREVCQARKPNCPECPLQDYCEYYTQTYLKSPIQV